jgi:alpha-mannosidase
MMMGRYFLKKEFNIEPKIAWHIDAFGHSSVNAKLFAEMGFDALVFSRLDH